MFRAGLLRGLSGIRGEGEPLSLSTDSRTYGGEDVFWCLDGPSFRGSDFAPEAYAKGCRIFVLGRGAPAEGLRRRCPGAALLPVEDPLAALQDLARASVAERKAAGLTVVGVTGSNGKTTTKGMLASILGGLAGPGRVAATRGNLNNHIGVPLTILSMGEGATHAVVEMGTSRPGEIALLAGVALPDAGLITSVGKAHLEELGDLRGVLGEKAALYDHVGRESARPLAVINRDDPMLRSLGHPFAVTFSTGPGAMYRCRLSPGRVEALGGPEEMVIENPGVREPFNQTNLLSAALLLAHMFPGRAPEVARLAGRAPPPGDNRCSWREHRGARVFLDAYNANPSSMEASLSAFREEARGTPPPRVLVVLGDMNELGPGSGALHREVGRLTRDLGFANARFVGARSGDYLAGNPDGRAFGSLAGYAPTWDAEAGRHDLVFLKGSRSLQMETLLDRM